MATMETLLDVETEVESVFAGFIAATPYNLGAIGSDTATDTTTPRVECLAEVVRWGPHQVSPASGTYSGRAFYDQFVIRLRLDVVYQPEHAQGQGAIRGTLRKALTDWTGLKAAFATRNYLYPTGDTLRQTDGGRIIDDAEKQETLSTVLTFEAWLNPNQLTSAT